MYTSISIVCIVDIYVRATIPAYNRKICCYQRVISKQLGMVHLSVKPESILVFIRNHSYCVIKTACVIRIIDNNCLICLKYFRFLDNNLIFMRVGISQYRRRYLFTLFLNCYICSSLKLYFSAQINCTYYIKNAFIKFNCSSSQKN